MTVSAAPKYSSVLNSILWDRREGARQAYLAATCDHLWARAIWRANHTPETYAAYKTATAELDKIRGIHVQLDGYVFSTLMKKGVDLDQLPADRDECPRCDGEIVPDHGCPCTNVVLALEHA